MPSNVIRVSLLADAKDFERGFGSAQAKAAGFGAAIGTLAAGVALQLGQRALSAVKDFVGSSIQAFSDLNETLNALEVVYGQQADGIKTLGEQAAQSIGASNAEFNQYAVSISAFAKQIAGDGGDVVGVVDDLSLRTADFASVMNLNFDEAAQKFRSGLAGESEPLRQYGIDVSAARIETQALNDGIWDGVGKMTEAQKVQARYNAIMEQTEQVTGDFARTADDSANKRRILTAEIENEKAALGEKLLPVYDALLEVATDLLPVITETAGGVAELVGELGPLIEALGEVIGWYTKAKGATEAARESSNAWMRQLGEVGDTFLKPSPILIFMSAMEKLNLAFSDNTGYSKEAADAASQLTDEEKRAREAIKGTADVIRTDGVPSAEALARAQEREEETAKRAREAQVARMEALREVHNPLFRLVTLNKEANEKQEALNKATKKYGEDSQEAIEAAGELASVNAEMIGILQDLKSQGIDPTGAAARMMLKDLGVPDSTIDAIFAQFDEIQGNLENRLFRMHIWAPQVDYRQDGTTIRPQPAGGRAFAEGGIVKARPGGMHGVIGEGGQDEAVTPIDYLMDMIKESMREVGGGGKGTGTVINLTVNAGMGTDGYMVGKQIIEAIQQYTRTAGPADIEVRVL